MQCSEEKENAKLRKMLKHACCKRKEKEQLIEAWSQHFNIETYFKRSLKIWQLWFMKQLFDLQPFQLFRVATFY